MSIWTPYGSLLFPCLDQPRGFGGMVGTERYSASLRFDSWDLDGLYDELLEFGYEQQGHDGWFRMPIRARHPDALRPYVIASSKTRPARTPFVEFHAGTDCRFLIEPYWYDIHGRLGVSLILLAVEAYPAKSLLEHLTRESARVADEAAALAAGMAELTRINQLAP